MSESSFKKFKKEFRKHYDSINYDKLPFEVAWKRIKRAKRLGLIKKGDAK